MSERTDTTSSSLMNIASLPLHRLNTRTLRSVQLTVLSLSLSLTREKETVQLSFLSSFVSLLLSVDNSRRRRRWRRRASKRERERKKRRKKNVYCWWWYEKGPFVHLLHRFSPSLSLSSPYSLSYRCEIHLAQYITSPIVNYRIDVQNSSFSSLAEREKERKRFLIEKRWTNAFVFLSVFQFKTKISCLCIYLFVFFVLLSFVDG